MQINEAVKKFTAWRSLGNSRQTKTAATYRVHLTHFGMFVHNKNITEVNLEDVVTYLRMLKEFDLDDRALMVKCIAIRKFFDFFNRQGVTHLDKELIPIIEGEYKIPKVAIPEDYYKVLSSIPDNNDPRHIRNKLMLMMFKDTGMRLGENLSLNLDMKVKRNEIAIRNEKEEVIGTKILYSTTVKTEKSKSPTPIREIFWTEETNDQLKKWIAKRIHLGKLINGCDPKALYISVTGTKTGWRLGKSGATEVMRRLSHEAGLTYVMNSHSIRHLFGHDLGRSGMQDTNIAIMMGHKTVQSSYPYRLLNQNEMAFIAGNAKRS